MKGHDDHVKDLVELIKGDYLLILTNREYGISTLVYGEIDVLALSYNKFDIYEVKENSGFVSMRKAVDQVKIARGYLGQQGSEFIYTPKNGIQPVEEVIWELRKKRRKKRRRRTRRDK